MSETAQLTTTIGKKDYVIPEKTSKIWDIFKKVFEGEILKDNAVVADVYRLARFEILLVYPGISKTCAARICKSGRHVKLLNDYDYILEFSGDLWDRITEKSKELLMLHELKHVNIDFDKEGNPRFRLIQHDVQDFYSILSKYGFDYITELRDTIVDMNKVVPKFGKKDDAIKREQKEKKAKKKNEALARAIKF